MAYARHMGGPSIYTPREPAVSGVQGSPVAAANVFSSQAANSALAATPVVPLFGAQGVRLEILEVATGVMTGTMNVYFRRPGATTWESVPTYVHQFTAEVVGGAPELNNIQTIEVIDLTQYGHVEMGFEITGITNGAVTVNASPF